MTTMTWPTNAKISEGLLKDSPIADFCSEP
jgi:hypothetical protein